jgi:hypothetical protein
VSSGHGINKFKHWRGQRNTWRREKCQLKLGGFFLGEIVRGNSIYEFFGATSYTPGSFNDILLNGALTMYTTFPVAVD